MVTLKELMQSECKTCAHCKKSTDKKGWYRISCPYAPGIEFLNGFLPQKLNPTCGHYKMNNVTQIVSEIESKEE